MGLRMQVLRRKLLSPLGPLDDGGKVIQRNKTIMNEGY